MNQIEKFLESVTEETKDQCIRSMLTDGPEKVEGLIESVSNLYTREI